MQKKSKLVGIITNILRIYQNSCIYLFNLAANLCPAIADARDAFLDSHSFAY